MPVQNTTLCSMEADDRPAGTDCIAAAAALLDIDAAAAEQRWTELPEDALDEEILAYRTGIHDVSGRLQELGVVVSLGEQDGATADGGEAREPEVGHPPWPCNTLLNLRHLNTSHATHFAPLPVLLALNSAAPRPQGAEVGLALLATGAGWRGGLHTWQRGRPGSQRVAGASSSRMSQHTMQHACERGCMQSA